MKVYDTANDAWVGAMRDIWNGAARLESRDGGCMELVGHAFKLRSIDYPLATVRGASPTYAAAETLWYLSGSSDVRMPEAYAPQYRRFAQPSTDRAHGAYGARMLHATAFVAQRPTGVVSQLDAVVQLLKKSPNTRQALVSMWDAGDLAWSLRGGINDIPCTVCLQFLLRDGLLHAVAFMRSNDVWLGLPYDVFAFTCIQRFVAGNLGVKCGTYTHSVGSLHLYDRNYDKAIERWHTKAPRDFKFDPTGLGDELSMLAAERLARSDKTQGIFRISDGSLYEELAARCCNKWGWKVECQTELMNECP